MNYTKLTTDTETIAGDSNVQRDAYVEELCKRTYTGKKQLYAILCQAFELQGISPEVQGTQWEDLSQGQKDLRTVYSQVVKQLGLA